MEMEVLALSPGQLFHRRVVEESSQFQSSPSSPNRTIVSNNRITEATVYRPANISILSRCCEILMADSISNERSIEWI